MASRAIKAPKPPKSKVRRFITPEGIDLELRIASAGTRFAALLLDVILLGIAMLLFTLLATWLGYGAGGDIGVVVWLLGFFLLRNFYFIGFELGTRAATPGKRMTKVRVVARDGGRLTADAVVARNLIRELELFLPLMFLGTGAAEDMVSTWMVIAGLGWALTLSLFLLFNADRMRMGDLIAGTWVVDAPRVKLDLDLATVSAGEALVFTDAELDVYGIYELQELERVLRIKDATAMRSVADAIRTKIGHPLRDNDAEFLTAYYRQLKARLERNLLFGKRRENKYAQ